MSSSSEACPPLEQLIAPDARQAIRDAIADNDGGEVFFVGRVGAEGAVDEVEAFAFGNKNAVPALTQVVKPGDVVIHNHPDGPLEPSDADISIASQLGDLSVGCYIVDNDCAAARVVVRAFRAETLQLLDVDDLAGFFAPNGLLARSLPGYEHRPQQVDMAALAARAFNDEAIAVIEAGTGVGKSMAYLLPAILWSARNKERVVVSTNTINLQEQLIGKDLPLLRKRLGVEFTAELLKGRGNYLCLRKAQFTRGERMAVESEETRAQLAPIFEWAEKTTTGSMSELAFVPSDEAWELVMSEADNCLRIKCPFYAKCFFYNARRRAARADVLVVNHHLLMADLAVRRESNNYTAAVVLPPFRRVIFDEAHNMESVATQHFGVRVSQLAFARQISKLHPSRARARGVLSFLAQEVERAASASMPKQTLDALRMAFFFELEERRAALDEEVRIAFDMVADDLLKFEGRTWLKPREEIKRRVTEQLAGEPFWRDTVREAVARVASAVAQFCQKAEEAIALLDELTKKAPLRRAAGGA
ncbi:MAG: hypothetical protein NTW86_10360 [Candidatus Sumerlaeota bacterium]|nr:hypothetical protein [Candidatus Sumerlaeota bacterium]